MGRPKEINKRIDILRFLFSRENQFVPISQIANHLGKRIDTISRMISTMVEEGLVEKHTVGRRSFVRITEKGKHMLSIYSKQESRKIESETKKKKSKKKPKKPKKRITHLRKSEEKSLGVSEAESQGTISVDVLKRMFLPRRVRLHDYKVKLYLDLVDDDSLERLFPMSDNRDVNYIIESYLSPQVIKKVTKRFWDAVYFSIPLDVDVTLEATTRAVIIHFHSKEFEFSWDVLERLKSYIYTTIAFVIQYIVTHTPLRVTKIEALNMHLAFVQGEFFDKKFPQRLSVSVELQRKAITPNGVLEQLAREWFDRSFRELEWELNDEILAYLYLLMPILVARLDKKVDVLAFTTAKIVSVLEKVFRPIIGEGVSMKSKGSSLEKIGDFSDVSEDIDFV